MSDEKATPKKSNGFYEWSKTFLDELSKNPNVSRAARIAGVNRATAYKHKKSNDAFSAAWDEAIEEAVDVMEEEMWRRAVEGTNRPIIHKGEVTGTFKEYSDTLMIFLAKAHRPERFRERYEHRGTGDNGEIVIRVVNDR